jgi:DUF1680 family protein
MSHRDGSASEGGVAQVSTVHDLRTARGPVSPTAAAATAHRPLDGDSVTLTGGLLGAWQQRNHEVSLPLALRQLETAGNLANLRLAISGATQGYRGPAFMDSDLYKTLEAIGWELARAASPALADFARDATALLEQAQQADGYLNSYVQVTGAPRYAKLSSSHELYCAGHLIQAAIACHRGAGLTGLFGVARRFADHLVGEFLGTASGLDGHPIIETALVELYRETGHAPYLRLASQFVEQRGRGLIGDSGFGRRYLQDQQPARESVTEEGHVVRALYLESGVADVAAETDDAQLLGCSAGRWDDMVATKTYLTGGNGSRHSGESFGDSFELPPDRAYNETCAAIASFQWSWRLLLATGDGKYADLMERVLYNGFAAATSTDGKRFFYVNPLQRREDHFEEDDPGRRREWFSCACCPPNIMRLVASLGHYLATTADEVLYLHQFATAAITTPLAGGDLAVHMRTGYPWSGRVEVRVSAAPEASCGLAFRVPGWSANPRFWLNGEPAVPQRTSHGYAVVRRCWQPGDVLEYDTDLRPRLTYPRARVDAVHGMAAIERGPLVYCFEQADQPAGLSVEDLVLAGGSLREREDSLPGAGPTVLVEADAAGRPPTRYSGLPYTSTPQEEAVGDPVTATAIPYFQWDNRDGRAMRVWLPVAARVPTQQ